MVFPVLTLPAVPLSQVLRGLSSSELFELHQCSQNTVNAIKNFEKANKTFKTCVDFQRNYVDIVGVRKFFSCNDTETPCLPETLREFDGEEVPTEVIDENTTKAYYPEENRIVGTRKIASEFIRTLGIGSLEQVMISEEVPAAEVLEWIEMENVRMNDFNLIGTSVMDKDKLGDMVFSEPFFRKVSQNFSSLLEVSPQFTPSNLPTDKSIPIFKLILHSSHWFTGRHLMAFNSSAIILVHSKLTNDEVNTYLKAWRDGNYSKLMYLSVKLADDANLFNMDQLVKDLADPRSIVSNDQGESIVFTRPDGKETELELSRNKRKLTFFTD